MGGGCREKSLEEMAYLSPEDLSKFHPEKKSQKAVLAKSTRAEVQRCYRRQSFQGTEAADEGAAGKQGWGCPQAPLRSLTGHCEKRALCSQSNVSLWKTEAME